MIKVFKFQQIFKAGVMKLVKQMNMVCSKTELKQVILNLLYETMQKSKMTSRSGETLGRSSNETAFIISQDRLQYMYKTSDANNLQFIQYMKYLRIKIENVYILFAINRFKICEVISVGCL